MTGDFDENDEPVEDVIRAFERGEKGFTRPPEPGEVRSIDFSEAHFLDHSLWECLRDGDARAYRFGGVRTHVRYAWEFKWGPELARQTLCRVGQHARTLRSMRDDVNSPWVDDIGCTNCGAHLQAVDRGDDDDR